jgi:hypothetical protein
MTLALPEILPARGCKRQFDKQSLAAGFAAVRTISQLPLFATVRQRRATATENFPALELHDCDTT